MPPCRSKFHRCRSSCHRCRSKCLRCRRYRWPAAIPPLLPPLPDVAGPSPLDAQAGNISMAIKALLRIFVWLRIGPPSDVKCCGGPGPWNRGAGDCSDRVRVRRALHPSIAAAGGHDRGGAEAPTQPAQGAGRRQPSSKRALATHSAMGSPARRAAAAERRAAQSSRRRGSCFAPCALITAVPVTRFSLPPVSIRIVRAGSNGDCLRSNTLSNHLDPVTVACG